MNRRGFLAGILGSAAGLVTGCAGSPARRGDAKVVMTVTWRYEPDRCKPGEKACVDWKSTPSGMECVIYAREPQDFGDALAFESAGHELWHCQGARH